MKTFDQWWQEVGIDKFGPSQEKYLIAYVAWNAAIESATNAVQKKAEISYADLVKAILSRPVVIHRCPQHLKDEYLKALGSPKE